MRRLLRLLGKNNECEQDPAFATLLGEDHPVALVQAVRSQLEEWAAQVPGGGSDPVLADILHRRSDLDPIVAIAPIGYDVADSGNLRKLLAEVYWNFTRAVGSRRVAEVRLAELVSARKANTRKSWWLRVGLAVQALGIVFLAAAALIALTLTYQP